MAALRTRNAVILVKTEISEGTDAAPSASSDAILVEVPANPFADNANIIQTNEATGSFDGAGPIVGGIRNTITFSHYLKGSGVAGTAPEFGPLLKACGWAETLTGTAVPSSAEACGAGGSTTTAELGSSAGTTAQQYRGMPIDFTSGVSGSAFITNYTAGKIATLSDTLGGTIDAGTNYQIPKNVLYSPGSTSISSCTIWMYLDGLLYKFTGCRGTMSLEATAGEVGKMTYTMSGILASEADTAVATPTYDDVRPPVFKNGVMKYNRTAVAVSQFRLDNGNELTFPDDPNKAQGFDYPQITQRRITGSINPLKSLIASNDVRADFVAGTRRIIHARFGATAGNRIGITIPQAHPTNNSLGDRGGLREVSIPFEAVGADAGAFICLY